MKNIIKLIKNLTFSLHPNQLDVNVINLIFKMMREINSGEITFVKDGKSVMHNYFDDEEGWKYVGGSNIDYIATGFYNLDQPNEANLGLRPLGQKLKNEKFIPTLVKTQIKIANKIIKQFKRKIFEVDVVLAVADLYYKLRSLVALANDNPDVIKFTNYTVDLSNQFKEYYEYTDGNFLLDFVRRGVYKTGEVNFISKIQFFTQNTYSNEN